MADKLNVGTRLNSETLSSARAGRPAYDRSAVTPGIVHLGVGAFHRAHQAVYTEDCLAAGDLGWGIVGASLRSADTRDALEPQDGLYTLAVRGGEAERLRVIGSLLRVLVAPEDPAALLAIMADPAIRIVTLTVSEKAYLRAAGGALDADHADIAHDLSEPDRPRTVFGFIVEALARRRAAGVEPFTVLCCDNLPANGATVRRLTIGFARLRDAELAAHVEADVAFPSTMVDRIVPATTDADRARVSAGIGLQDAWPVMTEPFMQWVIEDEFPTGRPRWEDAGATMVKDVRPFEDMKLHLLNGAHSGIAYLGLLLGHQTVSASFGDPRVRRFVDGLWAEAAPTLPADAGLDPVAYTDALAARFANTALVHRTAQIALDGSQKLPQRILAPARASIDAGRGASHLMMVVAAWIACCRARGAALPAGLFSDPLDARLEAVLSGPPDAARMVDAVFNLAGFNAASDGGSELRALAARHLTTLLGGGAEAALADL